MVNEQELQKKMMKLEEIKNQIEALSSQKEMVQSMVEEHEKASKAITNYSKEEEGKELLVSVGGNAHIPCKVSGERKVLIGLGSDVSALTEPEKAVNIVDTRKKELTQTRTEIENGINRLEGEFRKLQQTVQQEYQQMQLEAQQNK